MAEHADFHTSDNALQYDTCRVSVVVDMPEPCDLTRSSFTDDQLRKITDLNVIVYHDGKLLKECCRYLTDISSVMLAFPHDRDGFNIYMAGNVGELQAPEDEEDVGRLQYMVDSYDDFRADGFPVAEVFRNYRKGTLARFGLKMLVGRYDISMVTSAEDAQYTVTDVRLRNCARDVYPFGDGIKAVHCGCTCGDDCTCGDALTQEDIDALNSGGKVSLYFVENLQGVLLPDNDDRRLKIPSSLEHLESGVADRCTYLEVTADIVTQGARYTDGKYRFYLGCDQTTDFSVVRNTLYDVLLNFTQNMVSEEDWRIEVPEPEVVGVRVDKDEVMVIKGVEDMVFVQAYGNDGKLMDFDWQPLVSGDFVNVEKVAVNYLEQEGLGEAVGFRFTSNREIDGLYSYESAPSYYVCSGNIVSRETYNGKPLFSKEIRVRVYSKLFPLLLKFEQDQTDGRYALVVRGQNPMGLGLSVNASYTSSSQTATLGERCWCRELVSQTTGIQCLDNSINAGDGRVGQKLPQSVGYSDMTRVDFTVKGVGDDYYSGGKTLAYPRLIASSEVYTGENTKAFYGPGSSLSPGNLSSLPEDGAFKMTYVDSDGVYRSFNSDDKSGVLSDIFKWTLAYVVKGSTKVYFQTDDQGGNGVSRSAFKADDSHSQCPFYFMNSGLDSYLVDVYFNRELLTYPKENSSYIDVRFLAPGRDLFDEIKNVEEYKMHRMYYKVTRWKNLVGKIKTKQNSKYYKGNLYMTINGASSWVGACTYEAGYFL